MSDVYHAQSVESRLPKSASAKEKLEDIVSQLLEKYRGRTIYFLFEIKKENKKVKFDTVSAWVKTVHGLSLGDYFRSIGLLSSTEFFDISECEIELEDIKGKKCCAFSCVSGERLYECEEIMKKCGAVIVSSINDNPDYVYLPFAGKLSIYKTPACPDLKYDSIYNVTPCQSWEIYNMLTRRDMGELHFEVLSGKFGEKLAKHERLRVWTPEERRNAGLLIFNTPQSEKRDCVFAINNNIDADLIPKYSADSIYWSLSYFYDWYDASGGEIRTFNLEKYTVKTSLDSPIQIQKIFERFNMLCNAIDTPDVKSYISHLFTNAEKDDNSPIMIASLGYISDLEGCWFLLAKKISSKVISVFLEKKPILSWCDDSDYDRLKMEVDGIPPRLACLLNEDNLNFEYSEKSGYIYIDSSTGIIPKSAFANDPEIKYVEISGNIEKIDYRAFENCENLECVKIGKGTVEIYVEAFVNCSRLKNVFISDSVQVLGFRSFKGCSKLENLIFENESMCKEIGDGAFSGCCSLASITIPAEVNSIGACAFENCNSLVDVVFEDDTEWYYTTHRMYYPTIPSYYKSGNIDITTPSINANYFNSTYCNYYWFKSMST